MYLSIAIHFHTEDTIVGDYRHNSPRYVYDFYGDYCLFSGGTGRNPRYYDEPEKYEPSRWYHTENLDSELFTGFGVGMSCTVLLINDIGAHT